MQYDQLRTLQKLKQICIGFDTISSSSKHNSEQLVAQLKIYDYSNLSHAMYQALTECFYSISTKPLEIAINSVQMLLEDLINLQEKKILITDLQIAKVEESVKIHNLHYMDIIKQAQQNTQINLDIISQQLEFLEKTRTEIQDFFKQKENLKEYYLH